MKPWTLAFAALLPAGCSTADMDDPAFKTGYEAGCAAAHASPQARPTQLEGQPALYRHGFGAGYSACGGGNEVGR